MLNMTTRLAVKIKHRYDGTSSGLNRKPRHLLSVSDILPSSEDGEEFFRRAVLTVMELLVAEFECLRHLKSIVPKRSSPHPPTKSEVVPMKILFNDEKKTSETILILQQFATDAKLDGTPQVNVHIICKMLQ